MFRVTQEAEALLVQSAFELANIRDKHPERTWAGDQAATNLVMHERRFRAGTNVSVEILDPLAVPGGGCSSTDLCIRSRTLDTSKPHPGAQQFFSRQGEEAGTFPGAWHVVCRFCMEPSTTLYYIERLLKAALRLK